MTEVTRSCVRMLKVERTIRRTISYPFRLLITTLERLFEWINWCVVRSVMRLIGIPLVICVCGSLCNIFNKYNWNSRFSSADTTMSVIYIVIISILLCITVFVWIEIPDKEQEILDGKYD